MDKLELGCQINSALCICSGICDGLEKVVVGLDGSGSVSGSSRSNIHTQLLLNVTTIECTMRCKRHLFRNTVRHIISYALYTANTAH